MEVFRRTDVKLSKNPFTFIFIICIKKLSIYLCNLLIFCIFMHEIYQRNQQKPTPAFCIFDR